MSNQGNLKECKDCKANGITTMVLWMQNPERPDKRMPADYDTLLRTGKHVAHKCPYWKKTGTTVPQVQQPLQQQARPQTPPLGQATLPTTTTSPILNTFSFDQHADSIFSNLVLALQEISDKIGTMNQYLEILANKEVKDNPGIKSALQAKDDKVTISGQANTKDIVRIFEPQFCDHDQDGTVDEETGICTNCGTSFPAFIKKEDEFPSEEELDEVPESKRQRDPDAFPPL